jgi:signal transduction histidine kinase/DNA-binding response OmpR family regulator/HAMP domain-containing protein
MKLSIATKIVSLAFVLALAMAFALGGISVRENREIVIGLEQEKLANEGQRQEVLFKSTIDTLWQDVWYMSDSPEVLALLRARADNEKVDPQTERSEEECRKKLEEKFQKLLRRQTSYIQARYIDRTTGKEIVRVERKWHDQPVRVVPEKELSEKKDAEYFKKTIDRPRNSVYLSKIELNREGEDRHVEVPHVPVLRAAMPVYQNGDKSLGIVIINMDFDPISEALKKFNVGEERFAYVTNEEGDFLVHPERDKEFGFDLGKRFQIKTVYPSAKLKALFRSEQDHADDRTVPAKDDLTVETQNDGDAYFVHYRRVCFDPDPERAERFLVIALAVTRDNILVDANKFRNQLIWWAVGLLVVAAVLALIVSGIMTKSLKQIIRATNRLATGDYDVTLPEDSGDEIGLLSRAFQSMVTQVRERDGAVREREARIRAILDTAAEGIITVDADGLIESFNDAAEAIFHYTEGELRGQSVDRLMPWPCDGQSAASGTRKDGSTFPMEIAASEVSLDSRKLFTLIVRDVTERKQAEDEIRALNKDLDRRVKERTRKLETANVELDAARERAEQANRFKSQFLANMSHELRTPLNAVIGYSEMLHEDCEEGGHEEFLPDLDKINAAGKHLLTLINDILDLSKIAAGRVDLEWTTIDAKQFVDEVVTIVRPLVENKGNVLEVKCAEDLGLIRADVTRLKQCLFNLLSNAGKFTENGIVTLDTSREEREGDPYIIFKVIDTGIGLTPEQIDRLFQAFSQADVSTTRKYGGTGLGLTITRNLSRLMGGDVEVESEIERGSTFTLLLPAADRDMAAAAEPDAQTEPSTGDTASPAVRPGRNTVLVVDDDPAVCEMVQRFLTKEGYDVVTVARGEDVVSVARKVKPHAITLDVMMPEMDGWEVISALKADDELADIPVIMLTIVDDKNMGYAMGAADYLTKPLDRDRLLGALSKYCNVQSPGLALVIEDDSSSRELLRRTLEKDGWQVTEATNGRVALDCVANRCPSLILLDLMMPEMDGFEFLDELQQHPQWRSIPVVVITAKDLTDEDRMFLSGSLFLSGCVRRVLQKGMFDRESLLREVHELVDRTDGPTTTVK